MWPYQASACPENLGQRAKKLKRDSISKERPSKFFHMTENQSPDYILHNKASS